MRLSKQQIRLIKCERAANGWSMTQAARELGVSHHALSRMEYGAEVCEGIVLRVVQNFDLETEFYDPKIMK